MHENVIKTAISLQFEEGKEEEEYLIYEDNSFEDHSISTFQIENSLDIS